MDGNNAQSREVGTPGLALSVRERLYKRMDRLSQSHRETNASQSRSFTPREARTPAEGNQEERRGWVGTRGGIFDRFSNCEERRKVQRMDIGARTPSVKSQSARTISFSKYPVHTPLTGRNSAPQTPRGNTISSRPSSARKKLDFKSQNQNQHVNRPDPGSAFCHSVSARDVPATPNGPTSIFQGVPRFTQKSMFDVPMTAGGRMGGGGGDSGWAGNRLGCPIRPVAKGRNILSRAVSPPPATKQQRVGKRGKDGEAALWFVKKLMKCMRYSEMQWAFVNCKMETAFEQLKSKAEPQLAQAALCVMDLQDEVHNLQLRQTQLRQLHRVEQVLQRLEPVLSESSSIKTPFTSCMRSLRKVAVSSLQDVPLTHGARIGDRGSKSELLTFTEFLNKINKTLEHMMNIAEVLNRPQKLFKLAQSSKTTQVLDFEFGRKSMDNADSEFGSEIDHAVEMLADGSEGPDAGALGDKMDKVKQCSGELKGVIGKQAQLVKEVHALLEENWVKSVHVASMRLQIAQLRKDSGQEVCMAKKGEGDGGMSDRMNGVGGNMEIEEAHTGQYRDDKENHM